MLCNCTSGQLVLLSAAFALELSKCLSDEEIELYAAFFTAVGDQLALIALQGCKD